jgi:hypothetical protein
MEIGIGNKIYFFSNLGVRKFRGRKGGIGYVKNEF